MPAPDRRLALGVLLVGGVAFVVLAAVLIPWQWVPGGHYVHVPASQVFTAAQIARGKHYSTMQAHLDWASYAVSLVVALLLGLTRLGRLLVGRLRGWWWVRVIVGAGLVLLVGDVLTLPFSIRVQQHGLAAGLSTQAWSGWWQDLGISFLVSWIGTAIALVVLVGLARVSPRRWPLWGAVVTAVLAVLGSFVYPVLVEPLFNSFTPLPHGQLRSQIMHLAAVEHVHLSDVLVANASRQTTELNAYVSGFGSTRRVVLYDNLLKDLPRRQILAVVAHELGHAHHDDVLHGTILGACGGVAGVGLLGLLLSWPGLLRRSGARGAADPAVVPLALALAAVGSFLVLPVEDTMSRAVEARADRSSLTATHDLPAFIAMQKRLALSDLADPTPPQWSQLWFGDHPTTLQRIGIGEALLGRR